MTTTKERKKRSAPGQFVVNRGARGVSFGVRFRTAAGERVFEKVGQDYGPAAITEAEARERADQLLARVKLGQYRTKAERAAAERARQEGASSIPLFEDYAADWFERRSIRRAKRRRRRDSDERGGLPADSDMTWRLSHLNGWFAEFRLNEIRWPDVEAYATAKLGGTIREGGLSATSTNKTLQVLEKILRDAMRSELIDRNPVDGYRMDDQDPYEAATLEDTVQVEALLAAADAIDRRCRGRRGHGRALLSVLLFSGLRIGEALALTWRDVDLDNSKLRVRGREIGAGKTKNAKRRPDLLPPARDELAALKERRSPGRDDYVFATKTGNPTQATNVRRRILAKAVEEANVVLEKAEHELIDTDLTVHGLRHTYAAVNFYIGREAGYVSVQMGHANPEFTYKRYWKNWSRVKGEEERVRRLLFGEDMVSPEERDRAEARLEAGWSPPVRLALAEAA